MRSDLRMWGRPYEYIASSGDVSSIPMSGKYVSRTFSRIRVSLVAVSEHNWTILLLVVSNTVFAARTLGKKGRHGRMLIVRCDAFLTLMTVQCGDVGKL